MGICGRVLAAVALLVVTASTASASESIVVFREVQITTAGLDPQVLRFNARQVWPAWLNADPVDHALVFGGGSCTVTVPAGGRASDCDGRHSGPWLYAGTHPYHIRDTLAADGSVVVLPNERRVTLRAPRGTVRAGRALTLRGSVFAAPIGPLPGLNYPQRISLFRRVAGSQGFVLVQRVLSSDFDDPPCRWCPPDAIAWNVTIHPRRTATYVARAADPAGKTVWKVASTRRVVVRVAGSS
jgi:hypothetical protein